MSNHPTPEACRAVAAQLRRAVERYPEMELDMGDPIVKKDYHPCGTVHCHAGAYILGDAHFEEKFSHMDFIDYKTGAQEMAVKLGFQDEFDLEDWAAENPDLWGNDDGRFLFTCSSSFNCPESVLEIADWWDGVADRIEAYNREMAT